MFDFNQKNKNSGFTLAEMLVAMSLFVVAATIISGIFVRAVRTQRQANHLMVLNSDAGVVIERIVRGVREGYNFTQPSSSATCSDNLEFTREVKDSSKQIAYRLNNGNVQRSVEGGSFNTLNSSNVNIRDLCFLKTQPTPSDPWRITISMRAGSTDQSIDYTADLQTTVTSRVLPCETSSETCAYQ